MHRLLEAVDLPGGVWLEAGAGHGSIIQATKQVRDDIVWSAYELREECRTALEREATAVRIGDCLSMTPGEHTKQLRRVSHLPRYHVCVMNPPFRLAFEFLQMALQIADYVVMLQRLNYLGSRKRSEFFRQFHPDIYVLPDRPSFTEGQTDSIEYCWFVWGPPENRERSVGNYQILARTPVEERKAVTPGSPRLSFETPLEAPILSNYAQAPLEQRTAPLGDIDERYNPLDPEAFDNTEGL